MRLHGKDIYPGKYGSQSSHDKYAELIARWNSQQLWDEATNPNSNSARPLSIAGQPLSCTDRKALAAKVID